MAVEQRTSLAISHADALCGSPYAVAAHSANVAEHMMLGMLALVEGGHLSKSQYLGLVEKAARGAGTREVQLIATAQSLADGAVLSKRTRGKPSKYSPSLRMQVCVLVSHYHRQGLAIQERDDIAEAFNATAERLTREGLGQFSGGEIKGVWDRERKKGSIFARI